MSYTGMGYGLGQEDCPGDERWDDSIGACMCPAGTQPGATVGDCISASKPPVPQFKTCPLNTTITKSNFPIGCVCPDGYRFNDGTNRCESITKPSGTGPGPSGNGTKTAKAGLGGISPFLALAIVGAAVVSGVALYGKRKKK